MNRRMIAYILGRVLLVEAALMVPSVIVGFIYREKPLSYFLLPIVILAVTGLLFGLKQPQKNEIYAKEGFFVVAVAWIMMSLAGAIPFYLCGQFETVWDCIFEIVSGFTTTGASVLSNPEWLPRCILFWRSFSHWVGGMGVLVFVLAIIPLSDSRSLHLMRAEVPGPVVGKLLPRMKSTALMLYAVYFAMTLILIVLLLLGNMPLFDSICYAFGAAGTGGFATSSAGVAMYNSAYIEIVIGIFMLLFGVNFNLYFLILIGRVKEALKSEELLWYISIVVISTVTIALDISKIYSNASDSIRHAFFQVSTIITTTGYATVDFAHDWPQYAQHLLVLLMMIGACAGSTGGGLKISRFIIIIKSFLQEVRRLIHPRSVCIVRMDGRSIDSATLSSAKAYFTMYTIIICISVLLLSLDGFDFTTNMTAELACFNNIGPGIGLVGPMGNYSQFSGASKVLLSVNMLLGRLEIFPILILFSPSVWRKNAM